MSSVLRDGVKGDGDVHGSVFAFPEHAPRSRQSIVGPRRAWRHSRIYSSILAPQIEASSTRLLQDDERDAKLVAKGVFVGKTMGRREMAFTRACAWKLP